MAGLVILAVKYSVYIRVHFYHKGAESLNSDLLST